MASFVLENVTDKFIAWNIIFYVSLVVYFVGGIVFCIFAKVSHFLFGPFFGSKLELQIESFEYSQAEPQPWAQSTFVVVSDEESGEAAKNRTNGRP